MFLLAIGVLALEQQVSELRARTADRPAQSVRPHDRRLDRPLLIGSAVWTTADGVEVGRVDGAVANQGDSYRNT